MHHGRRYGLFPSFLAEATAEKNSHMCCVRSTKFVYGIPKVLHVSSCLLTAVAARAVHTACQHSVFIKGRGRSLPVGSGVGAWLCIPLEPVSSCCFLSAACFVFRRTRYRPVPGAVSLVQMMCICMRPLLVSLVSRFRRLLMMTVPRGVAWTASTRQAYEDIMACLTKGEMVHKPAASEQE